MRRPPTPPNRHQCAYTHRLKPPSCSPSGSHGFDGKPVGAGSPPPTSAATSASPTRISAPSSPPTLDPSEPRVLDLTGPTTRSSNPTGRPLWITPGPPPVNGTSMHPSPRDPHTMSKEFTLVWVEQSGDDTWRVRYRRTDNTIGSIPGFANETAAQNHADDWSPINDAASGATLPAARPLSANSSTPVNGPTPRTSTPVPRTTTAASARTTSAPAGATPRSTTSPTSKSSPGRRNSAATASPASPSTASSRSSR